MTTFDDICDALDQDGDTIELDDGRTLRLRTGQDEEPVMDRLEPDCYGKVAWVADSPWGHPKERPDGFTGRAEKIHLRDCSLWWEPPADVYDATQRQRRGEDIGRHTTIRDLRLLLIDLFEFGFQYVALELLDGRDAYERPIVVAVHSIYGVEPVEYRAFCDFLRADFLPDALTELGVTLTEMEPA